MYADPGAEHYLNLKVEVDCLLEMMGFSWRSPLVVNYCEKLTQKYGGKVIKPQCMPVGDMERLRDQLLVKIGSKEMAA